MIHTSYTVGITTGEYKALQYVMIDQKEWISNSIKNRARIASDEIINLNANDYVTMWSVSNVGWHGNNWGSFSGELLS